MELTSQGILQDLLDTTHNNLKVAEMLKGQSLETLNWKQDSQSWSILECIEHLNRYGDFYIPEITNKINTSKHKSEASFKSNWLGKHFVKSVSYSPEQKTMKTFKSMNPLNSQLNVQTLEKFTEQQHQIIELLDKSKNINLDKTKTAISISKLIKLKLGDTFRVLIYHNERHIKQAENALEKATK